LLIKILLAFVQILLANNFILARYMHTRGIKKLKDEKEDNKKIRR